MKKLEFVFDIFAANAKRLVIAAPSDFLKKQWMIKITYNTPPHASHTPRAFSLFSFPRATTATGRR
jgi:hypothetical protein